uniref:Uncharacterized protein n=1 Tax=Oryza sativa subsp. japonica TaxID=39947 RepID=Q5Z451_ORYSJ|nr:hypothetical protein [Oryza sativa Japonica Group]BAD62462.1 hypothetical protein [Oryza sativa Japonica Group]
MSAGEAGADTRAPHVSGSKGRAHGGPSPPRPRRRRGPRARAVHRQRPKSATEGAGLPGVGGTRPDGHRRRWRDAAAERGEWERRRRGSSPRGASDGTTELGRRGGGGAPATGGANRGAAKGHRDLRKVMDGLGERGVGSRRQQSTATELTSRGADGVPAGDGDVEEAAKGLLVIAKPKEATAHREVVWDGNRRRQMRRRPQVGVELDAAKPSVETAQHGGDENGGGGRLNDAGERRRLVARWGGFPVAIGEYGVAAEVWQRAANAMAQAARRGDGGSGRLEARGSNGEAGEWRIWSGNGRRLWARGCEREEPELVATWAANGRHGGYGSGSRGPTCRPKGEREPGVI